MLLCQDCMCANYCSNLILCVLVMDRLVKLILQNRGGYNVYQRWIESKQEGASSKEITLTTVNRTELHRNTSCVNPYGSEANRLESVIKSCLRTIQFIYGLFIPVGFQCTLSLISHVVHKHYKKGF